MRNVRGKGSCKKLMTFFFVFVFVFVFSSSFLAFHFYETAETFSGSTKIEISTGKS